MSDAAMIELSEEQVTSLQEAFNAVSCFVSVNVTKSYVTIKWFY